MIYFAHKYIYNYTFGLQQYDSKLKEIMDWGLDAGCVTRSWSMPNICWKVKFYYNDMEDLTAFRLRFGV